MKKSGKKVRSFAKRLTRRIMLALLVSMGAASYVVYILSKDLVVEEEQSIYEGYPVDDNERIQRVLGKVSAAVDAQVPLMEESLDRPDRLKAITERIARLTPAIHDCRLNFVGDQSDMPFLDEAIRRDEPYWSNPFYYQGDTLTPVVSYMAPVHDAANHTVAIVSADLPLDSIPYRAHSDRVSVEGGSSHVEQSVRMLIPYSFIIAHDGTYIAYPDSGRVVSGNYFDYASQSADTLDDHAGRVMVNGDRGAFCDEDKNLARVYIEGHKSYLFYTTVHGTDWTVAYVVPALQIDGFAIVVGVIMLVIIAFGLLVTYIVSRFTIRHATKPLGKLADSADEVAKGNFNTLLPRIRHNDEIRLLRDSFEKMQQSLTMYVEELKETTAEKASIESELKIAHGIQMSMLPKTFPPYPERDDIDIYGTLTPAKDVGGDLFDFYIRDEHLFFCIGDVSGKGVPASLVMAVTRSLFRNISAHVTEPNLIVTALNNAQAEDNDTNMFVTLFVGVLNLSNGKLQYCNAGHNAPLIIPATTQRPVFLNVQPNLPIGVMPQWQFTLQETVLEPQTAIFLFTDGLNEAEDAAHAQFGQLRIIREIESLMARSGNQPEAVVRCMTDAVHAFVGDAEQSDDLTMLAIRYQHQHEH